MTLNPQVHFFGARRVPFIAQAEAGECALACLAMIANFHGLQVGITTLRHRYDLSASGLTLTQVMTVAEGLGFNARPVRGEVDDLKHLQLPVLLHWNMSHYVVLCSVKQNIRQTHYEILDPARGRVYLTNEELSKSFTGVALELVKSAAFRPARIDNRLRIEQLWSSASGLWPSLANVLLLSVIIQFCILAAPFFSQIAIDNVLPNSDHDLLAVLAVGFAMLAVVSLASNWLRSLLITALNNALTYQTTVNLFHHLSRLPVAWFEKRHVGDIVSRFGSTQPIAQLISQGMVAAFVDGLLSLSIIVVMFIYSPLLCFVAVTALASYVLVRLVFLQALRLRNVDAITTAAVENSTFIESIRGITTLKASGQEANRQRIWQTSKANAVNAQVKLQRMTGTFDAVGGFVPAVERVLFIYIAIGAVLRGDMTIGMIFAFQSYKQNFMDAGMRLVEQAINYRLLGVHLNRISDIALASTEVEPPQNGAFLTPDWSEPLTLKGVRFRYGMGDPEVLKGVDLSVAAGEFVALIGPSGGGKTTLLRVMMGLVDPAHGGVWIGGKPLSTFSRNVWRGSIGSVLQDDVLFAGSLAENISFFDPGFSMTNVEEAAQLAGIHDEILSMPLAYNSLVGDMGSILSGGQRQRVLLARALYRKPKLLFLDEGTAHLDAATEGVVLETLSKLKVTRIMVAHRQQSIAAADRILKVVNGIVVPVFAVDKSQASSADSLADAALLGAGATPRK